MCSAVNLSRAATVNRCSYFGSRFSCLALSMHGSHVVPKSPNWLSVLSDIRSVRCLIDSLPSQSNGINADKPDSVNLFVLRLVQTSSMYQLSSECFIKNIGCHVSGQGIAWRHCYQFPYKRKCFSRQSQIPALRRPLFSV